MQSEFLVFLSLTSLLAGCVSSSVQLNDEYLFWKKWNETYCHTSRTEWRQWLSYRYNLRSVGLPQKPLGFTPISWCFCGCVMWTMSNSTFSNSSNTPVLKAVSVSPPCQFNYQDISGVNVSKPLPDKRAEFLEWQCNECSFSNIYNICSIIYKIYFDDMKDHT